MFENNSIEISENFDFVAVQFELLGDTYLYIYKNRYGNNIGIVKGTYIPKGSVLILDYNMLSDKDKTLIDKAAKEYFDNIVVNMNKFYKYDTYEESQQYVINKKRKDMEESLYATLMDFEDVTNHTAMQKLAIRHFIEFYLKKHFEYNKKQ